MGKERWLNKEVITAVHENDLLGYLDTLGVLKEIEAGTCICAKCGDILSLDNIGAVFPEGNRILLSCQRSLCLLKIDTELK